MLDHWNSNDPSLSFRKFAEGLKEQSKSVFLKDGFHTELFFLVSDGGEGCIIQPQKTDDRDRIVAELKRRIRGGGTFGVVHIVEGWTYFPKAKTDHTMKQILEGEIAVSELSPGDRTEALVVMAESRDAWRMMWVTPIRRDRETISLAPSLEFDEPPGGRFARLFGED